MPQVSVVIPVWNAAGFIGKAITSALQQADVSLEVLVVDDASTDQTATVVAAFEDPRVRYLRLDNNRGPAGARNTALDIARGEWIAVLDSDDMFLPGRLARLVAVADANLLDLVADNLWVGQAVSPDTARKLLIPETLDDRLSILGLTEYLLDNRLFIRQRNYGYLKPLFRRTFLSEHALRYDETLRVGEDFQLVVAALACGARYGRHASAGYVYLTHPQSTSHRLNHTNANAMITAARRFLLRFGDQLDPTQAGAVKLYLQSLLDGAAFIAMVDCVKQRRIGDLITHAYQRPSAIRHFSMPIEAALSRLYGAVLRRDRVANGRLA